MLQPRSTRPTASIDSLAAALHSISLCPTHAPRTAASSLLFVRHASHAAQGRANGPKDSAGRRLGAKKTASEWVIPGNIIYKQRGTLWFPGENVGIGKDHTIYATQPGYVVYYKNPSLHPTRKYIGVALEKTGPRSRLPTPPNAPRARRLGMYAAPIPPAALPAPELPETVTEDMSALLVASAPRKQSANVNEAGLIVRAGYGGNRIANVEIGRAAERKGVKVREFDRKDRWLAWRKRSKKVTAKIAARAARGTRKTKGKKSNKKIPVKG